MHACVHNLTGAVRVVGAPKSVACLADEAPQHWVRNLPADPPLNVKHVTGESDLTCS